MAQVSTPEFSSVTVEDKYISACCDLYEETVEELKLPMCLLGGTPAMREAGQEFLPKNGVLVQDAQGATKFYGELDEAYTARLNRSYLLNQYRLTGRNLRGRVFSRQVVIEASEELELMAENIDMKGSTLNQFFFDAFARAIWLGRTHILVEYPIMREGATLRDAIISGARPYLVEYHPLQLFYWEYEYENGWPKLTHIRIRESKTIRRDRWQSENVEQIRVLEPGKWEVYQKTDESNPTERGGPNEITWQLIDAGETGLDFIPLVTLRTNRPDEKIVDPIHSRPPLIDLAWSNLEHWQKSSNRDHVLNIVSAPFLLAAGVAPSKDELFIGPDRILFSSNAGAKLEWIEHSGRSITASNDDLDRVEARMRLQSMEPLAKRATVTATEHMIDQTHRDSELATWAYALQSTIERCLEIMQIFTGRVNNGIVVNVNTDYGLSLNSTEEIRELVKIWLNDGLSIETLWKELQYRGLLREDFDAIVEKELLEAEAMTNLQKAMNIGLMGANSEDTDEGESESESENIADQNAEETA